jgi:hypothetical protein
MGLGLLPDTLHYGTGFFWCRFRFHLSVASCKRNILNAVVGSKKRLRKISKQIFSFFPVGRKNNNTGCYAIQYLLVQMSSRQFF